MAVVEHCDVLDDIRSGFHAALVTAPVDPFGLQGARETLRHPIISAVSLAAHSALDAMGIKQLTEALAGILPTPIPVVGQLTLVGWLLRKAIRSAS